MIDWLESIDQQIILTINSWNSPFWDELMWFVSGKSTWIPLYLLLIIIGFLKFEWRKALFYVTCVLLAVGCTDFICSGIIKDIVQRYRPSHNLLLVNELHFYQFENGDVYRGGQYGFVSSHAGNFFALAWIVGKILKPYFKWMLPTLLILATIIAYSRIYLGVHYLSDIIGGFLAGTAVAFCVYKFVYLKFEYRFKHVK